MLARKGQLRGQSWALHDSSASHLPEHRRCATHLHALASHSLLRLWVHNRLRCNTAYSGQKWGLRDVRSPPPYYTKVALSLTNAELPSWPRYLLLNSFIARDAQKTRMGTPVPEPKAATCHHLVMPPRNIPSAQLPHLLLNAVL